MKLVIIGNGFDLHHRLNTSFNSFREYLNSINKIDLVLNIDSIIERHRKTLNLANQEIAWNNIESILNLEFNSIYGNIEQIENLEDLVEEFVQNFYEYLMYEENSANVKINENIKNLIGDAEIFIVFNYTKTYKAYIQKENVDVFHIHGELDKNNLPLIGYHRGPISIKRATSDYYLKYNNFVLHKPAMAFKQNLRDLDKEILDFVNKYSYKVNEVVVVGYSFGESDDHVYEIINNLLITQDHSRNMYYLDAKKLPKINFYLFIYNLHEANELINKLKMKFMRKFNRNIEVRKYGNGIRKDVEELIHFHLVDY